MSSNPYAELKNLANEIFLDGGKRQMLRKHLGPWRAIYPFRFKLHTLDGKPLVDAAMREWLDETVEGYRFEPARRASVVHAARTGDLFGPKPLIVFLVREVDAMMFMMRWGEDVHLHRRAVAEETAHALSWITQQNQMQIKVYKNRVQTRNEISVRFDPNNMVILPLDRP